jgi:hypothetical protein
MKRYGILPFTVLALSISAAAQGTSGNQPAASAQAQAGTNASATTSTSQQKQGTSPKQGSKQSAASGSAAASNSAGASATAADSSLNLASDTAIQATLLTAVDAKHSKPGDQVAARTTQDVKQDGHVAIHKGTKIIGHVTEAQARSKSNTESSVGVVFDNAVMKDGQQAPVHLGIQALAAAANQTSASMGSDSGMLAPSGGGSAVGSGRAAGGGPLGGSGAAVGGAGAVAGNVGQTTNGAVGATTRSATSAAGSTGGLNAAGQLTSDSRGVFGLQGLNLNAAASNATQGSVVSSTSRNVHLDSGIQMVLQVVKQ